MKLQKNITNKIICRTFKTLEKRFNKIHNNKYYYDDSVFTGMTKYINIKCIKHGVFKQMPSDHIKGSGCKQCSFDDKIIPLNIFIKRANKIHNNKYDYSAVKYKTLSDKIKIKCKDHGIFTQIANSHLSGRQCYLCSKMNILKFTQQANIKHKNKYDYSLIQDPINYDTKINIICKEHGTFTQIIGNHLAGGGCQICAKETHGWTRKRFQNKKTTLYVIYIKTINKYKIGITTKTISKRYYKDINKKDYDVIFEHCYLNGEDAFDIEKFILAQKNITKYNGKSPFKYTGILEIINQNPVTIIKKELKW